MLPSRSSASHSPDADASPALTAAPRGRFAVQMIQLISIPHALRFTCALKPIVVDRIRTTSHYNKPSDITVVLQSRACQRSVSGASRNSGGAERSSERGYRNRLQRGAPFSPLTCSRPVTNLTHQSTELSYRLLILQK